jgi:hypothetical protein
MNDVIDLSSKRKNESSDSVKVGIFKTTSGEEVISKYRIRYTAQHDIRAYELTSPRALVFMQTAQGEGLAFIPFVKSCVDGPIELSAPHVSVFIEDAAKAVADAYLQNVTGLTIAGSLS